MAEKHKITRRELENMIYSRECSKRHDKAPAPTDSYINRLVAEEISSGYWEIIPERTEPAGPIAPSVRAEKFKDSLISKIDDNTKLQDIVAEIKQQDQETINYIAAYMARYPGNWRKDNMSEYNKIKALGVGLTVYSQSTKSAKNMLKSELLKTRIGRYKGEDRKEMLDLFQKAKKMLNGEIMEDVTVKGLTRKSFTQGSHLHEALRESNLER